MYGNDVQIYMVLVRKTILESFQETSADQEHTAVIEDTTTFPPG